MRESRYFVALAALVALAAPATAQVAPPTSIHMNYPTPVPKAETWSPEDLKRVSVPLCDREKTTLENMVAQSIKSDAILVGLSHSIGDTQVSLDDWDLAQRRADEFAAAAPGQIRRPEDWPQPIAIDLGKTASMPYWTGERKVLDGTLDLENAVKKAAVSVDQLDAVVNVDPEPGRRAALRASIKTLSDALIAQAQQIPRMNEYAIKADTVLSTQEIQRSKGVVAAQDPSQPSPGNLLQKGSPIANQRADVLRDNNAAHDKLIDALKQITSLRSMAFGTCAIRQASPATPPSASLSPAPTKAR